MPQLRTLHHYLKTGESLKGKRVLLRLDLNVPMQHGKVLDDTRIRRVLPTIEALVAVGAKVIILSHFGRPSGEFQRELSLAPIADALDSVLEDKKVKFAVDCIGIHAQEAVNDLGNGDILLLENLRFYKGEEKNESDFADALAALGDFYVNDAFSCSHRAHASIFGIAERLPSVCGFLMEEELEHLGSALHNAERPLAAIVGGAKISTKLALLESLCEKVDVLLIGGGMANTFLHAQGYDIGRSLCEKDLKKSAVSILKKAEQQGCQIVLPVDVVVSSSLDGEAYCHVVPVKHIPKDEMILDIGPKTLMEAGQQLEKCRTVVWNGPLGVFEKTPYDAGTIGVSRIVAGLTYAGKMKSVAGGGDSIAALTRGGLRDSFSYISTAGGAFLEWLEGKELPGVKVLCEEQQCQLAKKAVCQ